MTLASKTEGYSISDLGDLVDNTLQQSMIRSTKEDVEVVSFSCLTTEIWAHEQPSLSMVDFEQAQSAFTPISLRGVTLQKSSVKWSDIGGKLLLPLSVKADNQASTNPDEYLEKH